MCQWMWPQQRPGQRRWRGARGGTGRFCQCWAARGADGAERTWWPGFGAPSWYSLQVILICSLLSIGYIIYRCFNTCVNFRSGRNKYYSPQLGIATVSRDMYLNIVPSKMSWKLVSLKLILYRFIHITGWKYITVLTSFDHISLWGSKKVRKWSTKYYYKV